MRRKSRFEWIKYAVDLTTAMSEQNGIYLCHWDGDKTYKFVTAGGTYGTQAIATTRGIRMTIAHRYDNQYNNGYTFTCTLNNPNYGSCLGAEPSNGTTSRNVYLDRGSGQGDRYFYWNITDFGEFPHMTKVNQHLIIILLIKIQTRGTDDTLQYPTITHCSLQQKLMTVGCSFRAMRSAMFFLPLLIRQT